MGGREARTLFTAMAFLALLAGCSAGSTKPPASPASPSATAAVATPTASAPSTPGPTPTAPATAAPTAAPSASGEAERDSLPSEFVGTWEMVPGEKWCAGDDCGIVLVIEACAIGDECGSLIEAQQPSCKFPLVYTGAGHTCSCSGLSCSCSEPCPGCVRFDASVDAGPGCDGHFGSGQTLRFASDGTLEWFTGDGWSAQLEPAP